MLAVSEEYNKAIVAEKRQITPLAIVDLTDPDMVFGRVTSSGTDPLSIPEQLHDKVFSYGAKYSSFETGRWILDGTWDIYPDEWEDDEQAAFIGDSCTYESASFGENGFYVRQNISNLSIMQAASVYFSDIEADGVGEDFIFEVFSGDNVVYSQTITGNVSKQVNFDGFTVHNVTSLKFTFTKWSLPGVCVRVAEIVPGIYEQWDGGDIYRADVLQQTDFSNITLAYSSCRLTVYNENKRFNPFSPNTVFQSIQERQNIPVYFDIKLAAGGYERIPSGKFFQQNGGWETSPYGLNATFNLTDIRGMIANKDFKIPDTLPKTAKEWVACLIAQAGTAYAEWYEIEPSLAELSVTVLSKDSIKNIKCGEILRFLCMAICAYNSVEPQTGFLKISPLEEINGILLDLSNMRSYPVVQENDNISFITFRLDNEEEYTIDGTLPSSDSSISISNPFIHTKEQANRAAANIMKFYGGCKFEINGRGNPACELADIDTFDTGFGQISYGRRYKQQFKFENGVMKYAPSYLLGSENQ